MSVIRTIRIENISSQVVQFIVVERQIADAEGTDITSEETAETDITEETGENPTDNGVVIEELPSIIFLHPGKAIELEESLIDIAQIEELRHKRLVIFSERTVTLPD